VENRPDPLITPEQLAAAPEAPLVLDLRPAEQFAAGHLASALHLDLWGVSLIDTSDAPLRAFMWMIGHLFSLRGVTPDRTVVVYDDVSGIRAARAFWFLEYLSHPAVRLLDGGSGAWVRAGFPLVQPAITPKPSAWHGTPDPSKLATWKQVFDRLGHAGTAIVDTRSDDEYTGRVARAARAGAVPGAIHLEWTHNLGADGRFKPRADLAAMYTPLGVTPDREVITYCQGGYRAAHTYVALRSLGYTQVRNYTGSWKEWGDRLDLPAEHTGGPEKSPKKF